MKGKFENKVAIVTGASSGIGKATAIAFAKESANVVVADIDTESGESTVRIIEESGGKAIFVEVDVSKAGEVKALIDKVVNSCGRLDVAFNNAGLIGDIGLTNECTEENWDRVIGINLKGVWLCMKYEIPQMIKQGKGTIVNASSVMGLVGSPNGISAYIASKHGVLGLTKAAALEYAQKDIRVNAVCPGFIRTPMIDRLTEGSAEAEAGMIARLPVGRLGAPEEIAEVVLWLCSNAASFVTGHAMTVDGCYTIQ